MNRLVSGRWISGLVFKAGGTGRRLLLAVMVAFLCAGCATVKVTTDYDRAAPFAKYRTYALEPAPHGQGLPPMTEAALRAALRVSLSARGIEELPGRKPDLAIVVHVFGQKELSPQQYASWGYGPGASWPSRDGRYAIWAGAPPDFASPRGYADGALVLDFVDARTRKLVFRGVGRGMVGNRESNAKEMDDAVAKMVGGLPSPGAPAR